MKRRNTNSTYKTITTVFVMVVLSFIIASCNAKKENLVTLDFDPESVPSMVTDTVVTLISDSGITRYKLVADLWEVYDKAVEPYWRFPKGLYLERFNNDYQIEATVVADSAWNYTNKGLWRVKGNVRVQNMAGDKFYTHELFLDQKNDKVYSDTYIEIDQANGRYLQGYGFESNQSMTAFAIRRPHDGRIPIPEENDSSQQAFEEEPENPVNN